MERRRWALLIALGSSRTGRSDGGHEEVGHVLADSHDIRQEANLRESRRPDGRLPLLGREEPAAGTVERVEPRRPERLRQVEDELRVDRLARTREHALGHNEAAAGLE